MKCSASVRLTLMGAAAATSLAACDPSPPPPASPAAYTDIPACVPAGHPESLCRTDYEAARKTHEEMAPRFSTREECLQTIDVDHCHEASIREPDGSVRNVFTPLMAGYMLRSALRQHS